MRRAPWLPVLAALLLAAGCVSETRLIPFSATSPQRADTAMAEEQQVRLVADGDAWRGNPSRLEHYLTPVLVRIDNRGDRPLVVRHDLFELVGESGFRYATLSPFERGDREGFSSTELQPGPYISSYYTQPPEATYGQLTPAYYGHRYGGFYGGFGGFGGRSYWYDPWWYGSYWWPGWYDPWFYGPTYAVPYYIEPLPTRDMVRRALPEGTLEPGASISGFLYFQDVGNREDSVTLRARLVDAQTEEGIGEITIPFFVRR